MSHRSTIALALMTLSLLLQGPAHAQWTFTDVTSAAQINHVHDRGPLPTQEAYFCGGVAAGDYDGDGWVDLFVVKGPDGANLLYRNKGDGTFEEVATAAGVDATMKGCGATFVDYDGDGWLDLWVGSYNYAPTKLYRNQGDGTFTDVSLDLPLTRRNNISASFGDYDRDGDLDAFVTHWVEGAVSPVADEHLWRNNGNGTFTDVGIAASIFVDFELPSDIDRTFTPSFTDVDSDGWPDILVASDFTRSQVFRNLGTGAFLDITDKQVITDRNGMGATVCDYDHDGDLDWYVTSIYRTTDPNSDGNRLYSARGDLGAVFEDVTTAGGVRIGDWGWGASCQDFNNDGHPDLFHVNGWAGAEPVFLTDTAKLYVSNGDGTFDDEAATRAIADTGLGLGVVSFDYDRDGDLDIFITNNDSAPKLYRNDGLTENYLTVQLTGLAPNTEAIGSRILVTAGGTTQMQELRVGSNYVSQDPAEAHFGLGSATMATQVEVQWFMGGSTVLTNVTANQILTVVEPANTCGDGVVDTGEECDLGAANGAVSCCQVNCRIARSGATCRGPADQCDAPEVCDGVSTACPADAYEPVTTLCRPAVDVCDAPDYCTGTSTACPADGKSTAECRGVAGACDVADFCDGVNDACPADQFEPSGVECRAVAGVCDVADLCSGSGPTCPADQKSTATCRVVADACDVAEVCDGVGNDCPADVFLPSGTECRAAAGVCDAVETCTGGSAACPADGKSSGVCRAASDACDAVESCDGVTNDCPVDGYLPSGAECRAVAGSCDVAESCTGGSAACPADVFLPASTECRAAAGECDVPEACTGSSGTCPMDGKSAAECRAVAGPCDVAESCDGVGDSCPADAFASGVSCRAAADLCDVEELCDGAGAACPADGVAPLGQVCRPVADICDVAEECTGADVECPVDTGFPDGDSDGTCDAQDVCPEVGDPGQEDLDSDGLGDACDPCTAVESAVVTKPLLKMTNLLKPGDTNRIKLKGYAQLAAPITPALDCLQHGVRIRVNPADDPHDEIVDVSIPPGAYDPQTREGWLPTSTGCRWRSKTGIDGITSVVMKEAPAGSGRVRMVVSGKKADYPASAGDVPLAFTVALNESAGQCGDFAFAAAPPPGDPKCQVRANGSTLLCR